jgi:hypothetical protein
MEQTEETNTGRLLNDITEIIRRYEEQWQKTGGKYRQTNTPEFQVKGVLV